MGGRVVRGRSNPLRGRPRFFKGSCGVAVEELFGAVVEGSGFKSTSHIWSCNPEKLKNIEIFSRAQAPI